MIDITAVVSNKVDYNRIMNANLLVEPYVTIINESEDPKRAKAFKSQYSAHMTPFIVINRDFKDYDVIYKEAYDDPIGQMIKMLNFEMRSDNNTQTF